MYNYIELITRSDLHIRPISCTQYTNELKERISVQILQLNNKKVLFQKYFNLTTM